MDSDTGTKLDPRGHSPHRNSHRRDHEHAYRNSVVYINADTYHGSNEHRYTISYASFDSNEHQNTCSIANEHADSDSDIHTDRFAD